MMSDHEVFAKKKSQVKLHVPFSNGVGLTICEARCDIMGGGDGAYVCMAPRIIFHARGLSSLSAGLQIVRSPRFEICVTPTSVTIPNQSRFQGTIWWKCRITGGVQSWCISIQPTNHHLISWSEVYFKISCIFNHSLKTVSH